MASVFARKDGAVATVVFSNPEKLNAATPEMWVQLAEHMAALDEDPAVRVVILTGEGSKAFVSGGDIGNLTRAPGEKREKRQEDRAGPPPFMSPIECSKPVVAKIRGFCMGGGLGLAASCDVRICSEDAQFRMPAARLGVGYGYVGLLRMIGIIGGANAADIFLSARRFGAAEALRIGYVQQVVPNDQLDAAVDEYCAMLAENAPLAMATAKRAINEALKDPAERNLDAVQSLAAACWASADFKEGRAAFMEKRKPNFTGR
jgi:enoyl-CoA hydratase/carnithine racemase